MPPTKKHRFEVDRTTLYEQVWSEPLTRLAPRYGLSDVGLAKLCARHDIPRPEMGYWMKLKHGKAPPRIPLPPASNDDETIEINPRPRDCPQISDVPRVSVSKRLSNPLPLVRDIADKLAEARPDFDHGLITPGRDSHAIKVSPSLKARSLRILDAIGKGVEAQGGRLEITKYMAKEYLGAVFEREPAAFRIRERLREASRTPGSYGDRVTLEPMGELEVEIQSYAARGLRKRWRDTSNRQIESQAGTIVATLQLVADLETKRSIEFEERRRVEDERRREAAEQARLEELEKARIERLRQLAADWRDAQDIRALVSAINAVKGKGREEFVEWALEAASKIDPTMDPERLFGLLTSPISERRASAYGRDFSLLHRTSWSGSRLD